MNSTSCILLITLLVIVVVGVCMSHPEGKAGMAVGDTASSCIINDLDSCGAGQLCVYSYYDLEIRDANCAPQCDPADTNSCKIKGNCVTTDYDGQTNNYSLCSFKNDYHRCNPCWDYDGLSPPGKVTNLLTGGQHRMGGKAGMAVGCTDWSDCPPHNHCVPFDANNTRVPSGAAGTCAPWCDGPDSCEKKGACQFWQNTDDGLAQGQGYCYSTEDQPCGQSCVRAHGIVTGGGKAGFASYPGEHNGPYPFGPNGPTDGKVTNLLTGGQHRTGGGKA